RRGELRPAAARAAQAPVPAPSLALVSDSRCADLFALVEHRERELDVAVLGRIGRKLVRPDRDVAPLEALTDVPDVAAARAPGGEVRDRALELHQVLAAHPLVGVAVLGVAV